MNKFLIPFGYTFSSLAAVYFDFTVLYISSMAVAGGIGYIATVGNWRLSYADLHWKDAASLMLTFLVGSVIQVIVTTLYCGFSWLLLKLLAVI